jgi:hypothetical protein
MSAPPFLNVGRHVDHADLLFSIDEEEGGDLFGSDALPKFILGPEDPFSGLTVEGGLIQCREPFILNEKKLDMINKNDE